jgi:hypothetical protein
MKHIDVISCLFSLIMLELNQLKITSLKYYKVLQLWYFCHHHNLFDAVFE